jgi:hypothetical protein
MPTPISCSKFSMSRFPVSDSGIDNLSWIHEKLAAGETRPLCKDFNVFAFERTGGPRRMYFVPEGQHDSSQARSASAVWTFGEGITGIKGSWHLLRRTSRLSPGLYPICANLICKISARRRGHAESPGAGRAKLRLSRGFPRLPACGITPQRSVVRLDDDVHGHLTS